MREAWADELAAAHRLGGGDGGLVGSGVAGDEAVEPEQEIKTGGRI